MSENILLNATNVNFLSFERLAKHYADLMDVWLTVREWDGFAWLETRYEDMVTDLEREGCRVTEFLGLPWHANQARFYEKSQTNSFTRLPTRMSPGRSIAARWAAGVLMRNTWRLYCLPLSPIAASLVTGEGAVH